MRLVIGEAVMADVGGARRDRADQSDGDSQRRRSQKRCAHYSAPPERYSSRTWAQAKRYFYWSYRPARAASTSEIVKAVGGREGHCDRLVSPYSRIHGNSQATPTRSRQA